MITVIISPQLARRISQRCKCYLKEIMESENLNNKLDEERIAASKLYLRLQRLSEVSDMEKVAISMFEFFAHLSSPHLTPVQEDILSLMREWRCSKAIQKISKTSNLFDRLNS